VSLAQSTNPKTVAVKHQAKWVSFRTDRSCSGDRIYVFTDGSSLGGFAAVFVFPDGHVRRQAAWVEPTGTRNVGAEMNGLLLGLKNAPLGAKICVVSDYLGCAAWLTGAWKIKDVEVRDKVNRALGIIEGRDLDVVYCHHGGHQKDPSDFTRWNSEADRLATQGFVSAVELLGDVAE
jgi:ribonuclease HI